MKRLLLALALVALGACTDSTAPQKAKSLAAPQTTVSYGRYILVSGAWVWCPECPPDDGG